MTNYRINGGLSRKIILSICILLMAVSLRAQKIPVWKLADLKAAIAGADRPTVFNFWATFCKPCVEEIPYFQQLVKKYDSAGIRLVLVSLDMKEAYPKIQDFAAKHHFTAPIRFLDETNADLFCPAVDSSWSGALPATLFVDNRRQYKQFFEGQMESTRFEAALRALAGQ